LWTKILKNGLLTQATSYSEPAILMDEYSDPSTTNGEHMKRNEILLIAHTTAE